MYELVDARYGKANVKVYKVHRDEKTGRHEVYEMRVCVLLEGDIETSYTKEDNSVLVTTDAIKNTTNIIAKKSRVDPPELFGATLASHFLSEYSHIHKANVNIDVVTWSRMTVDGKPHTHSFYEDGSMKRHVEVDTARGKGIDISSSITGLSVLKSTGSEFWGYIKDAYTTLPETKDRVLSSDVDLKWGWKHFSSLQEVEQNASHLAAGFSLARDVTFDVFAKDQSMSAQGTLYKMATKFLDTVSLAETIEYSWPNKHYIEIDLSWHKGLQNKGKDAEVLLPQTDPNGLIKATLRRSSSPKAKL